MFGKIININGTKMVVENIKKEAQSNLVGYHVVFAEEARKIVGEITSLNESTIEINLVGEIRNEKFISGVMKNPAFNTTARLIYKNEVEMLLGSQNISGKKNLLIGHSGIYDNFLVSADINDLFSGHFCVIGNTGSGKSCGVTRILQNIFYYNDEGIPENAHLVLFDVYGEYNQAFNNISKIPGLNFKKYTSTIAEYSVDELVKFPAYFLELDDLALLLNATEPAQLPIIEKALKLVYIFTSKDPAVTNYKNDIIAKSLLDILASGKTSTQIRDQIVAVLSQFNTETLNLDTIIAQPGYNRTLNQCMNIDAQGKMNSVSFVVDFLNQFTQIDLEKIQVTPDFIYTLDDLYYAFEFALISEGILTSDVVYEKANILKVRLHSIINSPYKEIFNVTSAIGRNEYITKFFQTKEGDNVQIVNMNFSGIDERFAKVLTKIYAKLFWGYSTTINPRGSFPIHLLIEEAHRYVQVDTDTEVLGYNIFDRITKEGRKYGVLLGFITQRPQELSKTALSQCSNFIVFRMYNPEDLAIISSMNSNITEEVVSRLKTLLPGTALVFGTAFKIPLLVILDLPEPMPQSTSVIVEDTWYKNDI